MSHDLFNGRFLSRREPAWHALGQVFDEPLTATEALERAKADIGIVTRPVWTEVGGVYIQVPDRRAIVREPTHDDPQYRVLGVASDGYTIIDNRDIARVLDPLTAEWPVETLGVLGEGATLFLTLYAGACQIAGEDVLDYFVVSDAKDSTQSLRVFYTPVRVVCANTLAAGISSATAMVSLRHEHGLHDDYSFTVDVMSKMKGARDQVKARLDQLAAMTLAEDQVAEVIKRTYPEPKGENLIRLYDEATDNGILFSAMRVETMQRRRDLHAKEVLRVRARREAASELYDRFNDEQPRLARTGWALYNGVVESADWRGKNAPAAIANSALFGPRAQEKSRCLAAIESLA